MKKIIILLFLPLWLNGQSFKELVLSYQDYCDEIVLDTVMQKGTVSYELIPVYVNGKIERYETGSADTVWSKPKCPEYKHREHWYLDSSVTISSDDFTREEPVIKEVKRACTCEVKRREVVPFSDHFWNWILNK